MIGMLRSIFQIKLPESTGDTTNPIYWFDRRRVARPFTDAKIQLGLLLVIPFVLIPIWLGFNRINELYLQYGALSGQSVSANYGGNGYLNSPEFKFMVDVARATLLLALIAVILMIVTNAYTLAVTINGAGFNRHNEYSDAVKLTSITPSQWIAAKQQIAQMRAWRLVVFEVAVRSTFAGLTFFSLFRYGDFERLVGQQELVINTDWRFWLSIVATIGFTLLVILYEPYWRMRLMVASGLRIATREKPGGWMMLQCGYAILTVHVQQATVIVCLMLIADSMYKLVNRPFSTLDYSAVASIGMLLLSWCVLSAFHQAVEGRSLAVAADQAFNPAYDTSEDDL